MPPAITPHEWAVTLLVFMFGCAVGSFLNVCIWRMPSGLSVIRPNRSFCPRCRTSIAWFDNVPLLSFLALGGRCRHCGGLISWRYFFVEGITGLLLAGLYVAQGALARAGSGPLIIMGLLVTLLIIASAIDMDFLIIPDEISLFGILGGLVAGALLPGLHVGAASHHTFAAVTGTPAFHGLMASAVGAVVGGGLVLVAALVGTAVFRREAMGLGDVKLMAMVGAFMGWKVPVAAFFVAPFFGLPYGLPLLIFKKDHVMPYGPFLSMGTVMVILFRGFFCDYIANIEELVSYFI